MAGTRLDIKSRTLKTTMTFKSKGFWIWHRQRGFSTNIPNRGWFLDRVSSMARPSLDCNGCLDFMEFKSTQTLVQPTLYILLSKMTHSSPCIGTFQNSTPTNFPVPTSTTKNIMHYLTNCNLIQDLQRTKLGKIFKFIKDRFIYQGSKLWSTQDQHKASKQDCPKWQYMNLYT